MKIFCFDEGAGERIDKFGSNFTLSKIARLYTDAKISCFHLSPNGKVGYHQAVTPQLLLVMQEGGWVRDKVSEQIPIAENRAVFWDKDEWHETGTNTGLVAIVIESEILDLAQFMYLEWDDSLA